MRAGIVVAALLLSASGLAAAEVAVARRATHIPAQGLGPALQALAKSRDLQVVYRSEIVSGLKTQGAFGELTAAEALTQLLRGTGLTYTYLQDKAVTIVSADGQAGAAAPDAQSRDSARTRPISLSRVDYVAEAAMPTDNDVGKDGSAGAAEREQAGASGGASEMVIFGERIVTRNRADNVEPTLVYEAAYFERFEPLTLNDMLKRVPGVYFDKLFNLPDNATGSEFADTDGTLPRFRNLDSQFSQILVNGRRIAGIDFGYGGDAFLQTIPAESIKEIRVVRSPSAEIDSSGVGMTLDVILKDGSTFGSNSWRIAGSYVDHELEGLGSTNVRGGTDRLSYSFSATAQNRFGSGYSILDGYSDRVLALGSYASSTQTRTTAWTTSRQRDEDRSLFGTLGFDLGRSGKLGIEAKYVQTATAASTNLERFSDTTRTVQIGPLPPTTTQTMETTFSDGEQQRDTSNYGLALTYAQDLGAALHWNLLAGYDRTDLDSANTAFEDDDDVRYAAGIARAEGKGQRYQVNNRFSWALAPEHEVRFGADLQKTTDSNFNTKRTNRSSAPDDGFDSIFSEDRQSVKRADLFGLYEWRMDNGLSLQLGVRHEGSDYNSNAPARLVISTDIEEVFQFDPNVLGPNRRTPFSASVSGLNPSAHLRWAFRENHDIRFSVAQTVRRPHLGELDPRVNITASTNGVLSNQVEVGNPELTNEEGLGFDLGYDWRFTDGIIGINLFHRRVENLIQQGNITFQRFQALRPDLTSEIERFALTLATEFPLSEPVSLVSYVNTGDETRVHGAEVDMSFPLSFISRDAHFYMNATYSKRKTGDQPSVEASAINFSYDHLIESLGFTYGLGMNWITKSTSHVEILGALISDSERELEPNFEIFLEKKFGSSLLARLTMENVTDAVDESIGLVRTFGFSEGTSMTNRLTQSDPRILFTLRGKF